MVLLFLVTAAFLAGLVDAIAGGGGLITVPALLAVGLPPKLALATNKGQAVFGATSSSASFWLKGHIDRDRAPWAFVFGALGSVTGALLLLAMRPEPLRPVVLTLLVGASVVVMIPRRLRPRMGELRTPRLWLSAFAFAMGAYDGFFGPGVGSLLIIGFSILFGDALTRASANAKVVNLASNIAALAVFCLRGHVLWQYALPMAAGNALGAFFGARLAIRRGDKFVQVVVLLVVTAVSIKLAFDMTGP